MKTSTILLLTILLFPLTPAAQETAKPCPINDHPCLFNEIRQTADNIEEPRWRDYAYRDLAVSLVFNGQVDEGISLIDKIENPDTQAMTIRAIGMAKAIHQNLDEATYKSIFQKLDKKAATITNPGAKDIAYTYIAMAQAFAGLDTDAVKTTEAMTNPALKHKAHGETAEIQAEKGKFDLAMQSVALIDSVAFKNKAYGLVSAIMIKREDYANALIAAQAITNPTKKAESLQKIINAQLGLGEEK